MPETAKANPGDLLVEFGAHDLAKAIGHDLLLHSQVKKPLAAIDRSLMFLHENKIIILQNGLAVFRQAMTIRLNHDDRKRPYTIGDYKPLATHYRERRFQVHVIMEYANLAMEKIARALGLVLDYFSLPRDRFVEKYFGGREDILERATSAEAYRQIVESLNNPIQIQAVGSPITANTLILGRPRAPAKHACVVHRCAYLLRVERVAARRILIMCFNHNAAVSLRKRFARSGRAGGPRGYGGDLSWRGHASGRHLAARNRGPSKGHRPYRFRWPHSQRRGTAERRNGGARTGPERGTRSTAPKGTATSW